MSWSNGTGPSIYLEVDPVPLHGVESTEREGGMSECPWCHHGPHQRNKCEFFFTNVMSGPGKDPEVTHPLCKCPITSDSKTELEALRNLRVYAKIRKDWNDRQAQAQRDLDNANHRLAHAQGDEDWALSILDKVRKSKS